MENEYDISCEGNLSERIYNQLNDYLIPAISKNIKRYKKINIHCAGLSDIEFHGNAVGAGISCGVDSFYTILKNLRYSEKSKLRVTHLCFFNVGGAEQSRQLYNGRKLNAMNAAKELGFNFVECDSNIHEILVQKHRQTHTFRTLSVILAMQKLFCIYYFSSACEYSKFRFTENDTAYYDMFTLPLLSNQNVRFELVGGEVTRLEKVRFLSHFNVTKKYLNVCVSDCNVGNCSKCSKCIRTMFELYLAGVLDEYKQVFDTNLFVKNKRKYTRKVIHESFKSHDMAEIISVLKQKREFSLGNDVCYFLNAIYFKIKTFLRLS